MPPLPEPENGSWFAPSAIFGARHDAIFGVKTSPKIKKIESARQGMERVKGIEPSSQAWEARILPLNHTRCRCTFHLADVVKACNSSISCSRKQLKWPIWQQVNWPLRPKLNLHPA